MNAPLKIGAAAYAVAFINMMDPEHPSWEVRTFDDVVLGDGKKRQRSDLTRAFKMSRADFREGSAKLAELVTLNSLGAGVFVTINRTDGKGKSNENVTEVTALFVDTDGAPLQPLLALQSHIVVQSSPGKWHIYFRANDCALDQFKPTQKAIAAKFGTDPAICDLPRVTLPPEAYPF